LRICSLCSGAVALGRFPYAGKNRKQLARLLQEPGSLLNISQISLVADLKPKTTLRSFFLDDGDFVNEVSPRFSAVRFSIVCPDSCPGLDQLVFNDCAGLRVRKRCGKRNYLQRKSLRPLLSSNLSIRNSKSEFRIPKFS
jgi:hypothetical protein